MLQLGENLRDSVICSRAVRRYRSRALGDVEQVKRRAHVASESGNNLGVARYVGGGLPVGVVSTQDPCKSCLPLTLVRIGYCAGNHD